MIMFTHSCYHRRRLRAASLRYHGWTNFWVKISPSGAQWEGINGGNVQIITVASVTLAMKHGGQLLKIINRFSGLK